MIVSNLASFRECPESKQICGMLLADCASGLNGSVPTAIFEMVTKIAAKYLLRGSDAAGNRYHSGPF